ncbi:hypothetical protein AB6A40_000640 [Gnathostoma spinigerum]|uniref:Triacylglycerol lipase n=1 Tax=Gnathostoma spinigerum TaxID=75299 RepID=A0ABD6E985_9BILA
MAKFWSLLLLVIVKLVSSKFTDDFREFIVLKYGEETKNRLERNDMGRDDVSMGGKVEHCEKLEHRPVIFVHGLHRTPAYFEPYFRRLRANRYNSSEMYGTTYGNGIRPNPLSPKFTGVKITCDFVKQVREFIEVVIDYTESKVDIVAHSLGSLLARTAILGGKCPGSDYDIGKPLTDKVHNYISVAGVNYGSSFCSIWPFNGRASCMGPISMRCNSDAIKAVNSQEERYEGDNSFALWSWTDELLGLRCCDHYCGDLKNANETIKYKFKSHEGIIKSSNNEVYTLLQN